LLGGITVFPAEGARILGRLWGLGTQSRGSRSEAWAAEWRENRIQTEKLGEKADGKSHERSGKGMGRWCGAVSGPAGAIASQQTVTKRVTQTESLEGSRGLEEGRKGASVVVYSSVESRGCCGLGVNRGVERKAFTARVSGGYHQKVLSGACGSAASRRNKPGEPTRCDQKHVSTDQLGFPQP